MKLLPGVWCGSRPAVARLVGTLLLGGATLAQGASDSLNLFTRQEGLHALPVEALADVSGYTANELHTWLTDGRYALWNDAGNRAWHYDGDARTLYFAAERYDTEHTDRNAYRLYRDLARAQARPMAVVSGDGPAPGAPGAFAEHLVLEEDNAYAPWALRDTSGHYWFWDYVYLGTSKDRLTLPLDLPDPYLAGCGVSQRVRVHLRGSSDLSPTGDHQVLGVLNSGPENRTSFDAFEASVLQIDFNPDQLLSGGNELELKSEPRAGSSEALQRLDRIEAYYCRKTLALDGQLWVHQPGPGVVTVGGLSGQDIAVIEDPAGEGAAWREDVTVVSDGNGGYEVSFLAEAEKDYLVADKDSVLAPDSRVDDPSRIGEIDNEADYLIIAPKDEMQAAAEELAAYRRSTLPAGSIVQIVWLQDIYDDFSGRRVDPNAITSFLTQTLSWDRVPSHVTLLGRGTLNHKGRPDPSHFPGESLIPVRMSTSPWGLFPSDNRFCDIDDDGVPEFACGRIPAETEEDAFAYIEKLEGFESAALGPWMDRMIGIADDPDPLAGDFGGDASASEQRIADLGYTITSLHYQKGDSATQLRETLVAALQEGAAITGYWGHGSAVQWGDENFLPIDISDNPDDPSTFLDIAALSNAPRLPVAMAMTCSSGNDAFPGFTSVAAALVANPAGGAIAALMPEGLSLHASAIHVGDHFFDLLVAERTTLGEAAREAKARAAAEGVAKWELDLFDVTGDPSVGLH